MRAAAVALLILWSPVAAAQTPVVVSHEPDNVSVTFYRNNQRTPDRGIEFDPDDEDETLGGYAMITERRTVVLPLGEVTVRFEGVASGIIPQSAILFDTDLKERNFDSRLLSKRGLIDAFTGQRVTIRRADPKTGKVTDEPGTIRSVPDALILHTAFGYEAIQCEGSLNTLLFPNVPVDLTAKPTLSLTTKPDQPGGRVTLTLAYLAGNFDWQANYVGTFSPDGQSLRLFGWMTLASRDKTSFVKSEASAVAGMLARAHKTDEEEQADDEARDNDPYAPDNINIGASCWPSGRTSWSRGRGQLFTSGSIPTRNRPFALRMEEYGYGGGGCDAGDCDEIIVTAMKRVERADLGDLKLYTISQPTTVAAQSMKQVRFLNERVVRGKTLCQASYRDEYLEDAQLIFRFDNKNSSGAGEPLPAGQISLFQNGEHGRQLIGGTFTLDKAVDEEVEIKLPNGDTYDVDVDTDQIDSGDDWTRQRMTVTNDNDFPIFFEMNFQDTDRYRIDRFSHSVSRRKGLTIWSVAVPAKDERSIEFRSSERPDAED